MFLISFILCVLSVFVFFYYFVGSSIHCFFLSSIYLFITIQLSISVTVYHPNIFNCLFIILTTNLVFHCLNLYFSFSYFKFSFSLLNVQIRVVNAFRQGLDARYGDHANTSLAEVLRKQTSLSKRLSETSSLEYADNIPDELTIPEIDVERLSSHSHTETAV